MEKMETSDQSDMHFFEKKFAKQANYEYLEQNVLSQDLIEEQLESIRDNFYLDHDGKAFHCPCPAVDGVFCGDYSCLNRALGVACPVTCRKSCCNNPWEKQGFAVDKGKLYVKGTEGKGFGIFAGMPIEKCDWIGEYTGVVDRTDDKEKTPDSYTFEIPICGHSLDASRRSSAMRLANHSHDPNMLALLVVHEGRYKVVFQASRKIYRNQELTVDYGWKFTKGSNNPECLCKATNCTKLIGKWIEPEEKDMACDPKTFENIGETASAQLQELLSTPLHHRPFNRTHRELHIHGVLEHVSAVVLHDEGLRIISGRVIECSKHEKAGFLYVVRRTYPSVKDYWLPMYLVFRHREMAEFVLMKVWSCRVRKDILRFLRRVESNLLVVEEWDPSKIVNYANMIKTNKVPKPVIATRNLEGSFGLGMSPIVLQLKDFRPPSKWGILFLPPQFHEVEHSVDHKLLIALPNQEIILEQRASPTDLVEVEAFADKELTTLREKMLQRQVFENTVNTIAHLLIRRQDTERRMSFQHAHRLISSVLENLYFNANPKDRKFLLYSHFRLAIEMHVKGSISLLWCSLCGLEETFRTDQDMRDHYFKKHAACYRAYVCHNCHEVLKLPSSVVHHLLFCNDFQLPLINPDIPMDLLDSLFDFCVIRRCKLLHDTLDFSTIDFTTSDHQQDRIKMDPRLKTPKLKNVLTLHTTFSTTTATVTVPPGLALKYQVGLDFLGDMSTNQWEYVEKPGLNAIGN